MKELKNKLIQEIIEQLELLAPDVMKIKGYKVTKVIQLAELTFEELENVNRIYWQQIEAKTGTQLPHQYKYKVDFNLN
jgi:hypothetical protein